MPSDTFLNPQRLKDLMQIAGMMILHSFILWQKKSGGVRPIAVGFALRRLVAKIAGQMVVKDMAELLRPRYGVRGGAAAAVHVTRKYLQDLPRGHALLKLDFNYVFNSVCWDKLLEADQVLAPDIYPLVPLSILFLFIASLGGQDH